jgi:hypothetical protein
MDIEKRWNKCFTCCNIIASASIGAVDDSSVDDAIDYLDNTYGVRGSIFTNTSPS